MACDQNYFVGQGNVFIRARTPGCDGVPVGSWEPVGDADELKIANAVTFADHKESQSGQRSIASRWITDQTVTVDAMVKNFNSTNLQKVLSGTLTSSAGGTATAEVVTNGGIGAKAFVANPNVTTFTTVKITAAPTGHGLTLPYTVPGGERVVDTKFGSIELVKTGGLAAVPSVGEYTLEVTYTYGANDKIEAMQTLLQEFSLMFEGINLTNPTEIVRVEVDRFQLEPLAELSLIGVAVTSVEMKGTALPINGKFYRIVKA
jgi:hypothetical protein